MQQTANIKRHHVDFQVGDWVFLQLQPYRQQMVFKRALQKLACCYFGPYQIEEKIGSVAYKLKLPQESRIHSVFHVSLLKKKIGSSVLPIKDLPTTTEEGRIILQPEAILDTRWLKKGSQFIEENLVKWKHLPAEDATWEDSKELQEGSNSKPRRSRRIPTKNLKYLD